MSLSPKLSVIYCDQWLLVLNKPAGLLSVPAKNSNESNLYSLVLQNFPTAKIVHRLDLPTSGAIIFALDNKIEAHLHQQFRNKQVTKTYIALVHGRLTKNSGTIQVPITVDWPNRPKQKICWEMGKFSQTDWQVIRYYQNATRLKLNPKTGRTHQLRLHLKHINHPIIGDPLYSEKQNTYRMFLHAYQISFSHPISNSLLDIRVPLDF